MELYAALDVAFEKTALCIVDREGAVVLETCLASDPDAIADRLGAFQAMPHWPSSSSPRTTAKWPCSLSSPRHRPIDQTETSSPR